MECNEMSDLLTRWLEGSDQQIALYEGDDSIDLRRCESNLLLSVQLTLAPPDNPQQEVWMRQGQASLEYFQGSLAQSPESRHLWLLQRLPGNCCRDQLLASLETLLNQRDTWRSMVECRRSAPKCMSSSLRLLSH